MKQTEPLLRAPLAALAFAVLTSLLAAPAQAQCSA